MGTSTIEIPATFGQAVRLSAGASVRIVTPEGPQVADTWAFNAGDLGEAMSNEHTRSALNRMVPRVGDSLYTNRFRPIMTMTQDTSPGVHDLLVSACSDERYAALGAAADHRSCGTNLNEALAAMDLEIPGKQPSPFNVFERVLIGVDGSFSIQPPVAEPGDAITLRAEFDVVVVVSACPMDLSLCNGFDRRCKPILLEFPES